VRHQSFNFAEVPLSAEEEAVVVAIVHITVTSPGKLARKTTSTEEMLLASEVTVDEEIEIMFQGKV
jgi:hypothetical protein